jgi:hypothetical protein
MSSVTYTIAEKQVIRAEILASLLRQRAEIDSEIEKNEAEIEALNSLKKQLINGDTEARAEAVVRAEAYAQAAHDAFQSAEAEAELRRREAARENEDGVFCNKCEEYCERNGHEHDAFRYDEDGENGICGWCYDGEYDSDEEEEEAWHCCKCKKDFKENEVEHIDEVDDSVCHSCCAFHEMVSGLNLTYPEPETDFFASIVAEANAEANAE